MRVAPRRFVPDPCATLPRLAIAAALTLAGCAPATSGSIGPSAEASSVASLSPQPTPTPDLSHPVGIIALGHSGLTGEGTSGDAEWPPPENSWATGTNPDVNSVYLRLVAAVPETQGHVANAAAGGAPASMLQGQANNALTHVPVPLLVIIQTIDSDIRCDGTDADHVPAFGQTVADVLDFLTTASPNSHILMVGQLGRPSVSFVEELVAHDPTAKAGLTGSGICDFFDLQGNLVEANFETLTGIINSYEAEQARVCAQFDQCVTDGGVRATYTDTLENFSSDWNHLNIKGQAAEAELIWPVVKGLLGI